MSDEGRLEQQHERIRLSIVKASLELYERQLNRAAPIWLVLDQNTPDLILVGGHIDQVKSRLQSIEEQLESQIEDALRRKRREKSEHKLRTLVMNLFQLRGITTAFYCRLAEKDGYLLVVGGPTGEVRDLIAGYDPDWPSPLSVIRVHANNHKAIFTSHGLHAHEGLHFCSETDLTDSLVVQGYLEERVGRTRGESVRYLVVTEKGKMALAAGRMPDDCQTQEQ